MRNIQWEFKENYSEQLKRVTAQTIEHWKIFVEKLPWVFLTKFELIRKFYNRISRFFWNLDTNSRNYVMIQRILYQRLVKETSEEFQRNCKGNSNVGTKSKTQRKTIIKIKILVLNIPGSAEILKVEKY